MKIYRLIYNNITIIIIALFFMFDSTMMYKIVKNIKDIYIIDSTIDGAFSRNAIYFSIKSGVYIDYSFLYDESFKDVSVITIPKNSSGYTYSAIRLSEKFNYIEGEGFTKEDIYSKNKYAVVGCDIKSKKSTINVYGEEMKIKGVLEQNVVPSKNLIIYTLNEQLTFFNSRDQIFVVDASSEKKTEKAFELIKKGLKEQKVEDVYIEDVNKIPFSIFVGYNRMIIIFLVFYGIIMIVATICITYYFYSQNRKSIAIFDMFGIKRPIIKTYTIFFIIFFVSKILAYLIGYLLIDKSIYNFIAYSSYICFQLFVISYCIFKLNISYYKKEISELTENDYE